MITIVLVISCSKCSKSDFADGTLSPGPYRSTTSNDRTFDDYALESLRVTLPEGWVRDKSTPLGVGHLCPNCK